MELLETKESINKRLIEYFGDDTLSGLPIWRVIYSEDLMEKRYGTFEDTTPAGIYLRTVTEVREVPKYRQWVQNKYILERLVVVPEFQVQELAGARMSYEPLWVFEDKNGNPLPPKWEAIKLIIDTVYAAQYSNHNLARYKDPEDSQEKSLEMKRQRVDGIIDELFGDQSSLQGTTRTGESIIVPRNFERT